MADRAARSTSMTLSSGERLFMLVAVWIPVVHVVLVATAAATPALFGRSAWLGLPSAVATLYLLPPIIARLAGATSLAEGTHALGGPAFRRWWLVAQIQAIFNRLTILEEALRLVPGLYSTWLRLWGSSIGGMVFWSPGTLVLDRSMLVVGRRVILGGGTRLTPHLLAPDDDGVMRLIVGRIRIGDDALIGGMSVLAPGVTVDAGVSTRAALAAPPHSHLTATGRVRGAGAVAR